MILRVLFILILMMSAGTGYAFGAENPVINEFYIGNGINQWVEIFNPSDNEVDISSWIIDDSGGTEKFIVPEGALIAPKGFVVFESAKFNLNKTSPDTVRFFHNEVMVDNYSYDTGTPEEFSYGRNIDGSGDIVILGNPTKGTSNNTSSIIPSNTPVPTNTPTPSKMPTPTKTIAPTKTPTPTKEPTPTKSLTIIKRQTTVNSEDTNSENPVSSNKSIYNVSLIDEKKGEISSSKSGTHKRTPTAVLVKKSIIVSPTLFAQNSIKNVKVKGIADVNLMPSNYIATAGGSGLLICCAIILALRIRKQKENS